MATPNVIAILQAKFSITDNLAPGTPYIANYDFQNPTLNATDVYFEPYFQALTTPSNVFLPAAIVSLVAIKNLSAAAIIQVNVQPNGAGIQGCFYGPGAICILFDPAGTGSGWVSVSITGVSVTVPCMVLVGK